MQYSFLSGSGEGPTNMAVVQPTTTSVMTQPPQARKKSSLLTPWQPSNKPTATVAPTAYPTRYCSDGRLCPNGLRVNDEFGNFYRVDEGEDGACCFDHCSFASADYFLHYVNANRSAFHFLLRERYGGSAPLREAITREVRGFTIDLAADFAKFPHFNQLPRDDVEMMATLLVNTVVSALGELLELPADHPDTQGAIARTLTDQLRVIVLGGLAWKPGVRVPTT